MPLAVRIGLVAAIAIVVVAILSSDRGVPLALLILLAFVVGFEYLAKRTRFGRHVYAVGGNAEASRRVWTALLGVLVIGSISNGMDLLALSSAVKFMVTGGVLLLAVIVDAIARKERQAAGRV